MNQNQNAKLKALLSLSTSLLDMIMLLIHHTSTIFCLMQTLFLTKNARPDCEQRAVIRPTALINPFRLHVVVQLDLHSSAGSQLTNENSDGILKIKIKDDDGRYEKF
ncbi:hypothetical protein BpHYR1_001849 [Brachionus plicatilis]|uniref:Uncharacterized protein n=2 Tax=Brachionus plicatilis TaxID=10195 RepID=A0A3M7Q001_BRAPC|nr:hypothetical protein BpHYR1_001849 [Brachionus plicatilis]